MENPWLNILTWPLFETLASSHLSAHLYAQTCAQSSCTPVVWKIVLPRGCLHSKIWFLSILFLDYLPFLVHSLWEIENMI